MFTVYLEKLDYNNNLNLFKNKTQLYIVQDLQIILTSLSKWKPRDSNLRNSISARSLYKVVFECSKHVIGEYKQNDAVELLMYVLNKLDSELRQRPPAEGEDKITFSDDPSFATSMFSSMLICRECCQGCGSLYTQRSETNLVISLGIPSEYYNGVSTNSSVGTLTDCLERFFGVEQLQDKRVDCKVCNSSQKSNSKIWISQLPEVLCLHLSRFVYENNQSVKVQTLIQFPMVSLDMSKYVQSENGIAVDREDCLYDLSSVIEHKGNR
ncbi:ubiquitin carboxyl-terminal hydrolase 3-like [Adelges cooleyi]|uniref:ubiquitin carboxyl-terminal hydrolase 3-like n=1 Tax=Adelges cooleyi TaxID=133065 RepID=UPI00217FD858|nr:ubiquitin carboxyl-terminal hydrolase 3-like [Adelges cooleyi]